MLSISKTKISTHVLILMAAVPTIALLTSSYRLEDSELEPGDTIPMMDVSMQGTDGDDHTLRSELKGNGLLVVFSCNTCPFVVGNEHFDGWEHQYNGLYEQAKSEGIGFVLINSNAAKRDGDDSMKKMKAHAEELGYRMNYLVDEGAKLADAFGAKTTPHLFAFNSEGALVFKGSIDNSWDSGRETLETYAKDVIGHLGSNRQTLTHTSSTPKGCSIKRKSL